MKPNKKNHVEELFGWINLTTWYHSGLTVFKRDMEGDETELQRHKGGYKDTIQRHN